jgi:hypothetical protein
MSGSGSSRGADPPALPGTIQQGETAAPSVTSVRKRNRERKRLQRERQRAIFYNRDELFLDLATLPKHLSNPVERGETSQEVKFLRSRRLELNAMPIVPDADVLERHARRIIGRILLNKRLKAIRPKVELGATLIDLPDDLRRQVEIVLELEPNLPWDLAVADIAKQAAHAERQAMTGPGLSRNA